MAERDASETHTYREERGEQPAPDPRERMAEAPLAPSSGGVLERAPAEEESTAGEDREAAQSRREQRE